MFWEVRERTNSHRSLEWGWFLCLPRSHLWDHVTLRGFFFFIGQWDANGVQPVKINLFPPISRRRQKRDPKSVEGNARVCSKVGFKGGFLLLFFFFLWEAEGWGREDGYFQSQVGLRVWKREWKILGMEWWAWDGAVNGVSEVVSAQHLPRVARRHCGQQRRFLVLNQSWFYLFL